VTYADEIFELADNQTRVDLLRGIVRLAPDGYAPAVAAPRRSELGNTSAWEDVEESPRLQTIFTASDNPGATWRTIARLLEQAERYANGEPGVQAVVVKARPASSRLTAGRFFAALCTGGRVPAYSPEFMRQLAHGGIKETGIKIGRRGAWTVAGPAYPPSVPADITVADEDVASASRYTGSANNSQEGYSASWGSSHGDLSPVSLVVAPNAGAGTWTNIQQVAVICAQNTGTVQVLDADTMSPGGQYSTVAGMNARSTNYLRFLPTGSTAAGTNAASVSLGAAFTAYMVCQAVAQPIEVYLEYYNDAGGVTGSSLYGGVVTIPAGTPRLVNLGYHASPGSITKIKLWCRSPNGTTSSPELRVDTLLLVIEGGDPHYAIVADYGGATLTSQTLFMLRQNPIPLSILNGDGPLVYATAYSGFTYSADPYSLPAVMGDIAVHSRGSSMVFWPIVLGTSTFRADVAAGQTITVGARRYPAYVGME
jgi:hypothetical protein